jgi:Phage tail lysozyme
MLIAVVSVAFSTHMEVYAAPDDPNAPAEEDGANSSGETSGRKFSPQDSGFSNNQYERGNGSEFYTVVCDATTGGYSVQLEGADNIEKVLNYFMAKGLTLAQAAGFVGNMMQESGVDPRKIQGGAIADDSYQMQNGVGFGLIQ